MSNASQQPIHSLTVDGAIAGLGSSMSGLASADAAQRLVRHGRNELRTQPPRPAWAILLDQLRSVVVLLLVAAAVVSLVFGDLLDAAAIAAVLVLNTGLGFVTELRARRAMESLLGLQAPRAVVVRDGGAREVPAAELVPGDLIVLEAGQFVPADARLTEATDLRTNEATLTGESASVSKVTHPVEAGASLPDRKNMVYQGTIVTAGSARALVSVTGMQTELGRIGELVGGIAQERTPLEQRLDALGKRLVWLSLGIAGLVAVIAMLRQLPVDQIVQTGIALAVAAVPESLPAVVTIALAVGMRRMAGRKALIRRLASAETLGSVTVICTDKTGTLTAGQMTATTLVIGDRVITISGTGYGVEGDFQEVGGKVRPAEDPPLRTALTIGALANHASLLPDGGIRGDPTEAALLVAARKAGLDRETLLRELPQAAEIPFSSERMFMATVHRARDGRALACVKGAPRRVVGMCTLVTERSGAVPLDDAGRDRLLETNRRLASQGLRVLALAHGYVEGDDEGALRALTFAGFVGMIDPPAPGVRETIQLFSKAGIRTIMITGDQKLTAHAVAADLGLIGDDGEEAVLDGESIAALTPAELSGRLHRVSAFSRVSPETKLLIVSALRQRGEIVAMLGDGVNDAPALRRADVGVAMGIRGTDVAKEAAAVVLQDDRFGTIGVAIREGRVIFDNVRKFVFYLFSCNLAEILVLLVAAAAGLPLPLLPIQILWLNLLTDTLPALSLAVEPADRDVMERPPRDPHAAIFSAQFLRRIVGAALAIAGVTLAAFWVGLAGAWAATPRAVTMSFVTLALAQTFHLGNARSREHVTSVRGIFANKYAVAAALLVTGLQVLALEMPLLARVLRTTPLSLADWVICVGLAAVPAIAGQVARGVARRQPHARSGR